MGDLVPSPPVELLTNGDFDFAWPWFWGNGWTHVNFQALCQYNVPTPSTGVQQNLALVSGKLYKVEFDLDITALPAATQLRVRFWPSDPPASARFTTSGHKAFYYTALAGDEHIRIYIWPQDTIPVQLTIDNVSVMEAVPSIAEEFNFLALAATKSETLDIDPTKANILLAHWNGKSNVLFEIEK